MRKITKRWYSISIRSKCILLLGIMLAVIWILVALVMHQLYTFSDQSTIIMNKYMDITGFMNAFSAENVNLEIYIRPSHQDAKNDYQQSIQQTDKFLEELQLDSQDSLYENALKRAICNAMEDYRSVQSLLLSLTEQSDMISIYLSLKTRAAYIDRYVRDLLHERMEQGGKQWRVIAETNSRNNRRAVLFLLLTSSLIVLVIVIFTKSILKPLTDLGHAADEIGKGQYDAPPLQVKGTDEVGRTAHSFNLMQTKIRKTVHALEQQAEMEKHLREQEKEAAQMQRRLQESRFAQLQSQIKPHFLFNTLNTIAALAREENALLSEDLILRLSSFFRYSLESDERTVTLGREVRLLRDYMELQETRYGDRIAMEIISDPLLESVTVPKFILQPLVENSIIHGLRSRKEGGHIRVRIKNETRGITITVTDNGCGFDSQKIDFSCSECGSVGLVNIKERIELSGGEFRIFSRFRLGTTVRLTLGKGKAT